LGPYKVIRKLNEVNYEVEKIGGRKAVTDTVHVCRMLPYNDPWTADWPIEDKDMKTDDVQGEDNKVEEEVQAQSITIEEEEEDEKRGEEEDKEKIEEEEYEENGEEKDGEEDSN